MIGFLAGILLSGAFLIVIDSDIYAPRPASDTEVPAQLSLVTPTLFRSFQDDNEGKININTADLVLLEGLPGIGMEKSQAIITFREKYGAFQQLNELLYVPGIGEDLFTTLLPYITLGDSN